VWACVDRKNYRSYNQRDDKFGLCDSWGGNIDIVSALEVWAQGKYEFYLINLGVKFPSKINKIK